MTERRPPLDELYNAALTGGAKHVTSEELSRLIEYAVQRNVVMHTFEAYEIVGNREVARPDLSIYGPKSENRSLPWPNKVVAAAAEARGVLAAIHALPSDFVFEVWLDRET